MATPHLAAEPGDFAPVVLMPGDPRRARRIAEELFTDARLVTEVRGILGFTGMHAGKRVSVLASGMGGPSLAIYATELARFFGVRRIVRVGTAGGLQPDLDLGTVVAASSIFFFGGATFLGSFTAIGPLGIFSSTWRMIFTLWRISSMRTR